MSYKLTAVQASSKNCSLAEFFETYGVISYGRGWRKDVVNQCLEYVRDHTSFKAAV